MNRIEISVQEEIAEPKWCLNVEPFLQKVMNELNFDNEEISLFFCNDDYIKELNKNYRNIDSSTDVLSFENGEKYTDEQGEWFCAGDIVISLETLPVNAQYFDENSDSELKRLLVHGILHLNGFDHGEEHLENGKEPQCEMLILQEKILKKLKDEKIIK